MGFSKCGFNWFGFILVILILFVLFFDDGILD